METVFWLGAFILMAGHRNLLIWAVALLSQPPNIFALRAAYGMLLVAPHFIAGGGVAIPGACPGSLQNLRTRAGHWIHCPCHIKAAA